MCVCGVVWCVWMSKQGDLTLSWPPIILWHVDLFAPVAFKFSLLSFHGEVRSSSYVLTERMQCFKSSGGLCFENKNRAKRCTAVIDGKYVFLPSFQSEPCQSNYQD